MNKQEEYELWLWLRKEYGEFETEKQFWKNQEPEQKKTEKKECPF
jgi:hypothetical protein